MAKSASVHGATRVMAAGPLSGSVSVPPSKSYTHRAVLMASLATVDERGKGSRIRNPLLSRDTNATVDACAAMGAEMERREGGPHDQGDPPEGARRRRERRELWDDAEVHDLRVLARPGGLRRADRRL